MTHKKSVQSKSSRAQLRARDTSVKESSLHTAGMTHFQMIHRRFVVAQTRSPAKKKLPRICWLRRSPTSPGRGTKKGRKCRTAVSRRARRVTRSQVPLITSITVSLEVPQGPMQPPFITGGGGEGPAAARPAGLRSPSAPPRNIQKNIPETVKTLNVSQSSSAVPANSHTQTTPSDLTPPTSELRLSFTSSLIEIHCRRVTKFFLNLFQQHRRAYRLLKYATGQKRIVVFLYSYSELLLPSV